MPHVTIELTTDENYIKSVFLNPKVYSEICDDSSPQDPGYFKDFNILDIPGFFLKVIVDGKEGGSFWSIWKGNDVEVHTALLDNCKGRSAIEAARAGINWVFKNTEADAITSYAWSDSPAVKWFCRAVGMHPIRTEKWPNTRKGKPVDITYFSIKREEVK